MEVEKGALPSARTDCVPAESTPLTVVLLAKTRCLSPSPHLGADAGLHAALHAHSGPGPGPARRHPACPFGNNLNFLAAQTCFRPTFVAFLTWQAPLAAFGSLHPGGHRRHLRGQGGHTHEGGGTWEGMAGVRSGAGMPAPSASAVPTVTLLSVPPLCCPVPSSGRLVLLSSFAAGCHLKLFEVLNIEEFCFWICGAQEHNYWSRALCRVVYLPLNPDMIFSSQNVYVSIKAPPKLIKQELELKLYTRHAFN